MWGGRLGATHRPPQLLLQRTMHPCANAQRKSFAPMPHETTATDLFQPARLGPLALPNRIVMAPLTRSRTGSRGIPGPLNAEYYAQRASAGLIITEATQISRQGQGYALHPRHPRRRAGRRLEAGDRRRPPRRRPDRPAALACRPHLPSQPAAGRRPAGGALGHQPRRQDLHRSRLPGFRHAPRAGDRRDRRHRRSDYRHAAEQRQGGRLRRRRDPCRQRLPDRPVPARQDQPAHATTTAAASRTAPASCWR